MRNAIDPALLPSHLPVEKFFEGDRLLQRHTEDVFGEAPTHRQVRIMVTLPTLAADNYQIEDLVNEKSLLKIFSTLFNDLLTLTD